MNLVLHFDLLQKPGRRLLGGVCFLMAICVAQAMPAASGLGEDGVVKLPQGTVFGANPPPGWTNIVFVSTPKVTQGDVADVSATVRDYAEMLHLVVLANVEKNKAGKFELERVGFGLAVANEGTLQVVSGPAVDGLDPPEVGILERQIIGKASESLDEIRVTARRTTLALIDSPAVYHDDGKNRHRWIRMLVWVDSHSGRIGQMLWLLKEDATGTIVPALGHAVYLPAPFHEKKPLYVDRGEFSFLGIPGPLAFALVQLPPGKRIPLSNQLAAVVSRPSYNITQLGALVQELTRALRN